MRFCGATLHANNTCTFKVWAPLKKTVTLHLINPPRQIVLIKDIDGYFSATVENVSEEAGYLFTVDGSRRLPDPASNYQPEGVHGASRVVNHSAFKWNDASWKGIPLSDLVLYEIHVGTFTPDGTFEAIIPRLNDLASVGINAIELMPVSQFPGNRNWGYDGVFPYAVQQSYGGPEGLKKLVNACHLAGIAVILDVVYNHVGPEGNTFTEYGPYFTARYSTPWGNAINFDDAWSDGVREYFCKNALYWFEYYRIDGLRLDAIHTIFDNGAVHFLQYVNDQVGIFQQRAGRPLHMIAESDLNSPRVINPRAIGGYGFSAQWLDDFHHALYVLLDEKGRSRHEDFGSFAQLAKAFKDGFVHSGEYVKFRKRRFGVSSSGISGDQFVAFTSNHDQIGNRPGGERLSVLLDFERLKIAAAALILSPYVPMLFMGEEYGEDTPFYYFVSHSDPALVEAVRKGRREEFRDFHGEGESPDPADPDTFQRCVLSWEKRSAGRHKVLLSWYRTLISLRNETPALKNFSRNDMLVTPVGDSSLAIWRCEPGGRASVFCVMNLSVHENSFQMPDEGHGWRKVLDSRDTEWCLNASDAMPMPQSLHQQTSMAISPLSVAVYRSE